MTKKTDWFRVGTLLALASLIIAAMLLLGRSPIGWLLPSAVAQTVPPAEIRLPLNAISTHARLTHALPINLPHQICWIDPNNPPADVLKLWRYRVEGGPRTLYLELPRAQWVADDPPGTGFCHSGIRIPKAGHWVYDAALCWGTNCSVVGTASCGGGTVEQCIGAGVWSDDGWWIYVFVPPPSSPVVN